MHNLHDPSEDERCRIGEKFKALAAELRANLEQSGPRKKFVPYTDAELRAMYPPREPAPQQAAE